jgi:hypothetical protein
MILTFQFGKAALQRFADNFDAYVKRQQSAINAALESGRRKKEKDR